MSPLQLESSLCEVIPSTEETTTKEASKEEEEGHTAAIKSRMAPRRRPSRRNLIKSPASSQPPPAFDGFCTEIDDDDDDHIKKNTNDTIPKKNDAAAIASMPSHPSTGVESQQRVPNRKDEDEILLRDGSPKRRHRILSKTKTPFPRHPPPPLGMMTVPMGDDDDDDVAYCMEIPETTNNETAASGSTPSQKRTWILPTATTTTRPAAPTTTTENRCAVAEMSNKVAAATTTTTSTLYIPDMCCATEVPAVQRALRGYRPRINIVLRHVYVEHNTSTTDDDDDDLETMQTKLRREGFASEVVVVVLEQQDDTTNIRDSATTTTATAEDSTVAAPTSSLPSTKSSSLHSYSAFIQRNFHIMVSGCCWVISCIADLLHSPPVIVWLSALVAVVYGLAPVAHKTCRRRSLQSWLTTMDSTTLMLLAAAGSLVLGDATEAASVAFLFGLGDALEGRARQRAADAVESVLLEQQHIHNTRTVVLADTVQHVPASSIVPGTRILIRPGDIVPADGVVMEGATWLDVSAVTGEAMGIMVGPGHEVLAGSGNVGEATLVFQTTRPVPSIRQAVQAACTRPSHVVTAIQQFASIYTPVVLGTAAVLATVPWLIASPDVASEWTRQALVLLVIACPCALQMATPVAYAAGLAAAARHSIVVTSGQVLEQAAHVVTVFVDKTGTITTGTFELQELSIFEDVARNVTSGSAWTRQEVLEILARMEMHSHHPLAKTLVAAAGPNPQRRPVEEHRLIPGQGVTASVDGVVTFVGNERLVEAMGCALSLEQRKAVAPWHGTTVGFVGQKGIGIIAAYSVADQVRPHAAMAVQDLQARGLKVVMLSGDSPAAAEVVARQVAIHDVHSELLPEDKLHLVGSAKYPPPRSLWRPHKTVLFCGDGVNDALALAASADIGVAMGEAAAVTLELADVTLLDSNLSRLVYLHDLGVSVVRTVRQNIVMSLLFKLIVTGLTLAGYVTLSFAIASDVGGLLLVTMNALQLLPQQKKSPQDDSPSQEIPSPQHRKRWRWQRYGLIPTSAATENHDLELNALDAELL